MEDWNATAHTLVKCSNPSISRQDCVGESTNEDGMDLNGNKCCFRMKAGSTSTSMMVESRFGVDEEKDSILSASKRSTDAEEVR